MYVLAFATGMRQGELLGLRWAYHELEPGLNLERGTARRASTAEVRHTGR